MTRSCPVCGAPNEDSANFCGRCGYNFDQQNSGQSAGVSNQNVPPFPNFPNVPPDYNFNLFTSLGPLRKAFLTLFIGLILLIIPSIILTVAVPGSLIAFIGFFWPSIELLLLTTFMLLYALGGILVFVGVIRLIYGFHKVSKTSLSNADYYRSTRNWLLASLFGFLVDVSILAPISAIETTVMISSLRAIKISDLLNYLWAVGIVVIALILYLVSYIKLIKSLKFLSKDLQVKKLHTASNYLHYSLIMYIILIILLPILLFVSISAIVHSLSSNLISQSLPVELEILVGVVPIIILFVLQAIGYYFAYAGIRQFESRYYDVATKDYESTVRRFP